MHDHTRVHIMENFHERNDDCTHIEWLIYSSDLNQRLMIKDACDMLGRALVKVEPKPTTRDKLLTKLQIQWAEISQHAIQKLFRSIRRRFHECTTKRSGHPHS